MKYLFLFLILSFTLFSCKKEMQLLSCNENCETYTIQGRVYNGITNQGLGNTVLRIKWEESWGACYYCDASQQDIHVGRTDATGNFTFSFTIDTLKFQNYSLKLVTPEKENFINSYVGYLNTFDLNQAPINIVYYPSAKLTFNLNRVQQDSLRFVRISHQWRFLHNGQLINLPDYSATRPINGGDTTFTMTTVADLATTVVVTKSFFDNSFIDIKDSIVCRQEQNNYLTVSY